MSCNNNNFDAEIDGPPAMHGSNSADHPAANNNNNTVASQIEVTQNSIASDEAATHK